MADLIPFPLSSRTHLVRSMVDDLECVHGPAASEFWRLRIAEIVGDLRTAGMEPEKIRQEIYALQEAVQDELQIRFLRQA